MARGLTPIDISRGYYFVSRAATLVVQAGEPTRVAVGLTFLAVTVAMEKGARASSWTTRLLDQAEAAALQSGDPYASSVAQLGRAYILYSDGRFRETATQVETLIEHFIEHHPGRLRELDLMRILLQNAYWLLGDVKTQVRTARQWLRDAEERGDRFLSTFISAGDGCFTWLMHDDPTEAQHRAEAAMKVWSQRGYHFQHWNLFYSTCCIDLYRGDPRAAHARLEQHDVPLRRSMIPRAAWLGVLVRDVYARVTLAEAALRAPSERRDSVRRVRSYVSWLRRNRAPWACALADLFDASRSALEGRTDDAVSGLKRAIESLDAVDMSLYAACARWRLGDLLGGDEGAALRGRARAFMEDAEIRSPQKVLRLLAPAFDVLSA
jgi:hypothetical protein